MEPVSESFIMGIDEAGRGPVLGPLVYACCACQAGRLQELEATGVRDSKKLSAQRRERIFQTLGENADWIYSRTRMLSPEMLSATMLGRKRVNLNETSYAATISLVKDALSSGMFIEGLFVDTVGEPDAYQMRLKRIFPKIPRIVVQSEAESRFAVVAAASIIAKVTRDKALRTWTFPEEANDPQLRFSREYGSGYPADPLTQRWLRKHLDPIFGFPSIVRFSWSTCSRILEKECVQVDWPEEDSTSGALLPFIMRRKNHSPGPCGCAFLEAAHVRRLVVDEPPPLPVPTPKLVPAKRPTRRRPDCAKRSRVERKSVSKPSSRRDQKRA